MQFTAILFATVVRVIDGDSLVVNLPCDIDILCRDVPVRLQHIDTPEMHGKCAGERLKAHEAKAVTQQILPPGTTITIARPQRDKYFRLLADVPSVSNALIEKGLAKPYEGGTKSGWCDMPND